MKCGKNLLLLLLRLLCSEIDQLCLLNPNSLLQRLFYPELDQFRLLSPSNSLLHLLQERGEDLLLLHLLLGSGTRGHGTGGLVENGDAPL